MKYHLPPFEQSLNGTVQLTSSKSESNRSLLINALSGNKLTLRNLSAARDTETMTRLLNEQPETWDVLDAGTTMRFCTAYLAIHGKENIITGTERMLERPIGILAEALMKLGAKVEYLGKEGYPPLKITGIEEQLTNELELPGNVSSQFISALLMIAPCLPDGLNLRLTTEVFSRPYIEMTLRLMDHFGAKSKWKDDTICIESQDYKANTYTIESDWSGASYWYSMAAMNRGAQVKLLGLREKSLQGDQEISRIMTSMGVNTIYDDQGANLVKINTVKKTIELDFKKCPDLAQTVMVAAAVKGIPLKMTGLESLRIKETDRIDAMQRELAKLGAELTENDHTWELKPGELPKGALIETYDDHRMAMAFAPLSMAMDVMIEDPSVVKKSYPAFWDDLESMNITVNRKEKK